MKIISAVFLFFSMQYCYSQSCKLPFRQLLDVVGYEESAFETFALKNGFSYDAQNKNFHCDFPDKSGNLISIKYGLRDGIGAVLVYSFQDKEQYLNFKQILEQGKFIERIITEDTSTLRYELNGVSHALGTSTFRGENFYSLSIAKIKE